MNADALAFLFLLGLLGYGGYRLFLLLFRPDIVRDQQRQAHELRLVREQRNRNALGLLGWLLRLLFRR